MTKYGLIISFITIQYLSALLGTYTTYFCIFFSLFMWFDEMYVLNIFVSQYKCIFLNTLLLYEFWVNYCLVENFKQYMFDGTSFMKLYFFVV